MNALFEAAKRGDVTALKKALNDPNIDPNAQDERTGFTALHVAVVWQNKVCLYELLNIANVNLRDNFGRRPFDLSRSIYLFEVRKFINLGKSN